MLLYKERQMQYLIGKVCPLEITSVSFVQFNELAVQETKVTQGTVPKSIAAEKAGENQKMPTGP